MTHREVSGLVMVEENMKSRTSQIPIIKMVVGTLESKTVGYSKIRFL